MDTPSFIFKRPKDDIFWLLTSFLFLGFSIYISFKDFTSDNFKLIGLLLPLLFAILGIALIKICLTRRQYYELDKNKAIYLDKNKRQIKIDNNGNLSTISSSDIKDIEIFNSWNTNPLFSTLGYMKLNLQNGDSFIITKFTATQFDLESLIAGHQTKTTTSLISSF